MVSDWLTFTLLLWVMSMVLLFASIGLSLWWGALLGNTYYGFFAIAGCYLLLLVAVRYLLSPHLKKVIIQRMLKYLQP